MPTDRREHDRHRVLALLWHAPQEVITSGGLRRTSEILDRVPGGVSVLAIDNSPSFFRDRGRENFVAIEYHVPGVIRALEKRFFWLERVLEWALSTVLMTAACVRLRATGDGFDTVLVPSSEQIPALLAGIIAKHIFLADLVACSTNLDIFPPLIRKPLARLHNRADTVIVISQHLAREFAAYGVSSRIVVNGVGLDTEAISSTDDPATKDFDAVFVGRHDSEKGIFDLIRIWHIVVKELPSAKLVMIGSCNPPNRVRLASLISECGLEDKVTLMGTVDDAAKYSLFKRSKVCLFPSHVEEWGIVPQEALACGLPVVVYDLPVYEENIKPCEAVFRLPVGDIPGMARSAIELLAGNEFQKYDRVGPDFVSRFGWDEVADREFQVLTGLMAPAGADASTGLSHSSDNRGGAGERSQISSSTTFSIVIPALNEERNIGGLIEDILRQELPGSLVLEKIVVVSDGSTDDTDSIVRSHAALDARIELLVNTERLGNAQAINIGKSRGDSDFLVILDGDIRLDGRDCLNNLLSDIEPGVGMVGGNPRPVRDGKTFGAAVNECGAFIRDALRPRIRGGNSIISALGCILALDKSLYKEVEIPLNPDSPELLVPNDQYFYMKCLEKGMRFVSRENARVYYKLCSSIRDSNRQGVRFVFSMSSMNSFFDDALITREYHFPLRAVAGALVSSFWRRPVLTLAWGALHLYVQIKVYVWRHLLKKGVNAAWEVSKTSKSGMDWSLPSGTRGTRDSGP